VKKPQYLFIDGHESHWDPDALELLLRNNVYVIFLRSNNSGMYMFVQHAMFNHAVMHIIRLAHPRFLCCACVEDDQPNDNGPNAVLKSCYTYRVDQFVREHPGVPMNPAFFNEVIKEAWDEFKPTSGPVIAAAFRKCRLHPLAAPTVDNQRGLRMGEMFFGQQPAEATAAEANVMLDPIQRSSAHEASGGFTLLQMAQSAPNKTILVRTIAWEVLKKSEVRL
jgi:hypothetical protein